MESSLMNYKTKKTYIPGAMFGPFSFIHVNAPEPDNEMKNIVEIAVAFRILQLLHTDQCAFLKHYKISMAILSPNPDQVKCMQQKFRNQQRYKEFLKVSVGAVEDYQPGEADVVIISTAGAERSEVHTTSSNYLTWARRCLWILGDERKHLKGESVWKPLILEAKARGCFFHADESKDLAKVICEVNKDLHQLDELVSGESTLFRNTTWKVLFSTMFKASFSRIESWESKKLVFLMLLKLSSGWRPRGSSSAASICKSPYSELMKEFKVKGLHLICTIDITKEEHFYTQVLKVWDILPFHEIEGLVGRLEGIIRMYTHEYIDCCKAKCVQRGSDYKEYPMTWHGTPEIVQYTTPANQRGGCIENVKVRESLMLMKFYSLSTEAVNTTMYGCDGGYLGIPFELTEQEKNVVSFNKSSFILGRSGTGKTTVLTMKLFQNEQLYHLACEGFHKVTENKGKAKHDGLHQLFVTFSPKLCYAVRQQFGEWKRLTCGGGSSTRSSLQRIDDIDQMMLSEGVPDQLINLPQDVYPLIITFHRFLLMLDGTVGTSYFTRFPNVRHLINDNKTNASRLNGLEQFMKFKEVTYERFCSAYWPHFNRNLTKNLEPSAIYTEIMSVIKGGFLTDKASNGILRKEEYVALCDGRVSIFDARKREIIYSIFLQYEYIKVENGNFDLADLVNDLHQRLQVEGYEGDIIDYVYIDEVQDLSMKQIMLFKYVCTNVQEGFAFSGDTAQAIAKGIGFRFEDIRCLFFKEFLSGSVKGNISKILQLSENFRTHAGILNLAQSVINLLYHFFPLFVDALSPESSRVSGDLPILLETNLNNNAIKVIFERNGNYSRLITGFGAEQVVLVRDESLKDKVVNIVGRNALVLTIMESKGLEFEDVLLYDFFTTSSFSNEWRVIYTYMKDKDLLKSPFTTLCSCFDMQKHAVLCSELKQMYVAITRTRQRLWICESNGFSEPIYDYWKQMGLVEVKHLSDSFAEEMQVPSSKDEWRSRGIKLFHENNFKMAQMCFLNADDRYSEKLAEAYHLRAIGGNTRASQPERKRLLKDAAELFSSIGKNELAAECFYEIEDYLTAGYIYKSVNMLEKAGNCFYLARCYELAVKEYEKAEAFAKCLSATIDGKLFETGFERLDRWGVCGDARKKFLRKGARYYFSTKDFENMMKFVRSFGKKDDMRSFLTERWCFDELVLLEKEWGNFEEALKVIHKGAKYYFSIKDFERMMKFVRSFGEKDEMRSFLIKGKCFDELVLLEKEWGNFEEALKVIHKGAIYYFSIKDFERMMKFVRSFCEKDEMRSFLIMRRCFDELVLLEKEWGNFEEALKVIHTGANYYFSIKDSERMMKFVRSFGKKDDMRSFLTERWCFDELVLLEKEWGNFEEAARVARRKPDPVLAADLLRMGGLHKESSLVILWHVFSNSPIFPNVKQPFTQKDELLRMAVSTARRESDVFYQFVCQEAKILSHGETKEELFEKGLEFIYCYKENAFELDVSSEWVKTGPEIKKIEKNVIDLMRSFLKSVNCRNKLILLDEVCGEFVEAAKIGYGVEHSIEAAMSRLWYVFFGSLWAYGSRAWPLKDFKHKYKLLDDAKACVMDHPDSPDSALVHTEIHVLSGEEISLSKMWRYLRETPRERSLKTHFLISRRVLEVHLRSHFKDYARTETQVEDETVKHLERILSKNSVSVEGLIYFWNYWKDMICELINWSRTGGTDCQTSQSYEEFIFNYFGVRKYDVDKYGGYVVLDAEAQWVKQTRAVMSMNGYLCIIHPRQFSAAALQYWYSELFFVAEKVCSKFQPLQNLSIHEQTRILMCLFELVKSLQKCECLNRRIHATMIVDKHFHPFLDHFMLNVVHLNWKHAQSKDIISIRRSETFLNTLKEAIGIHIQSVKSLTRGQLGRVAVLFLGHKMTGFNIDTEKKLLGCFSPNWSDLFTMLMKDDRSVSQTEYLAVSLHNVLKEIFPVRWRTLSDCMSPACFIYLMDRLLILSFWFRGYVFTTRSSCVEWLSYHENGFRSNGGHVTSSDVMNNFHDSLSSMVSELLNSEDELMEWLRRSKEPESWYSILILRLIVLLSLICANSGLRYDDLYSQLKRSCIVSLLPDQFRVALVNGIKEECLVDAVAEACKMIDNPLVVVMNSKEDFLEVPCQNAKFLHMEKLEAGQELLIEMLYLENCNDAARRSRDDNKRL